MIYTDEKLEKLDQHINKLLRKDIYINKKIDCCQICEGNNYIKYGKYNEIQRYRCKDCNKTFSKTTNSLWSYSKKLPNKWIEFLELTFEKKSLRICSEKLNISLVTAFYWRHKVLHGLKMDKIPHKLSGNIYVTKWIMKENFKGCRKIETTKRRNIWIISAKGKEDYLLATPICKDLWDLSTFKEKIYSQFEKNSYIVAYGDRYLSLFQKEHNKGTIAEIIDEDRIKYFGHNLITWLSTFCGIATKYLEEYLCYFILFNLDKDINYIHMIYSLSIGNRFIKTEKIGYE